MSLNYNTYLFTAHKTLQLQLRVLSICKEANYTRGNNINELV